MEMEAVYGWIRNLIGFFLFVTVIEHLLPGDSYRKYVRLFSGMVMILLVLKPLSQKLQIEERIARYYESFVFRYEADELKENILGIEEQRLEQMIAQYEEAVELDVKQMAEDMGFVVRDCRVKIDGEESSERFGTVTRIFLTVSEESADGEKETATEMVEPVEPVIVGGGARPAKDTPPAGKSPKYDRETAGLRRRIASYYGLEESYVEIQIIDGKG